MQPIIFTPFHYVVLALLAVAFLAMLVYVSVNAWNRITRATARKTYLVREMRIALTSREGIYPAILLNYCKDIVTQLEKHNSFKEDFKGNYTYGSYDICVHWDTYSRKFEFTLAPKYDTIATIHYPGAAS